MEGLNPPLQVGGVQAAVMAALPVALPETFPMLPNTLELLPTTGTACGELEVHVSCSPVSNIPALSVTKAFTAEFDPFVRKVVDPGASCSEMDRTGQVVNWNGWEFTPPALATIDVVPGVPAVANSRFRGAPGPGDERETAALALLWPDGFATIQLN